MADFTLDLSGVTDEIEEDIQDQVIRRFGLGVLTRVIKKSPVDTGRFKGSWSVTFAASDQTPVTTVRSESAAIQDGTAKLSKFDLRTNTAIYITSNLPYAQSLEEGSSTQAPTGVAQISIREEAAAFDQYKVS